MGMKNIIICLLIFIGSTSDRYHPVIVIDDNLIVIVKNKVLIGVTGLRKDTWLKADNRKVYKVKNGEFFIEPVKTGICNLIISYAKGKEEKLSYRVLIQILYM